MKTRTIANWAILGVACALIVLHRLVDAPALGWIGDIFLIVGVIMLPQTVALNKKTTAQDS